MRIPTRALGASAAAHPLPRSLVHAALLATALVALVVTGVVGMSAAAWIGRPFPGFFLLPNRTVPSIGRETWTATRDAALFQRSVIAVDGRTIAGNGDAYAAVAAHTPGTPVAYTLRDGAATERVVLAVQRFSRADFWVIFGSYLATGLLYLWAGLLAAWRLPDAARGRALLLLGGIGGVYALTGAGLYDADADMRLHAVAEACFPAALVGVALAFARPRRNALATAGTLAWWLSLVLAAAYQLLLGHPAAYSIVHGACETYCGAAGLALGATLVVERARAAAAAGPLLRGALAGTALGIGVPAVILILSGLSGGRVPVNLVTATAFLFPLCLGWGVLRESGLAVPHAHPARA